VTLSETGKLPAMVSFRQGLEEQGTYNPESNAGTALFGPRDTQGWSKELPVTV